MNFRSSGWQSPVRRLRCSQRTSAITSVDVHCPGIATPKELGLDSDSEHTIFCMHWCHQASAKV
jgi:hypothetical protein